MNFDESKLFITSGNPVDSEKVSETIVSTSLGCETPSNIPHVCHSVLIKDDTNLPSEGA